MRSARRPGIVASVPQRRKRPGSEPNRRWRDYQTGAGRRPVRDFLASLDDDDAAAILAAMKDVAKNGLAVAERLDEEIHEVKADGRRQTYRVLFSPQAGTTRSCSHWRRSRRRLRRRRLRSFASPSGDSASGNRAATDLS